MSPLCWTIYCDRYHLFRASVACSARSTFPNEPIGLIPDLVFRASSTARLVCSAFAIHHTLVASSHIPPTPHAHILYPSAPSLLPYQNPSNNMPRQSRGPAAAPRRPVAAPARPSPPAPQQTRQASTTAAAPPQQQQGPPAQAGSQGPGLFGQMASTAA